MSMMHEAKRPSRRLVLAGLAAGSLVSSRPANAQTIAALKASGTLRGEWKHSGQSGRYAIAQWIAADGRVLQAGE